MLTFFHDLSAGSSWSSWQWWTWWRAWPTRPTRPSRPPWPWRSKTYTKNTALCHSDVRSFVCSRPLVPQFHLIHSDLFAFESEPQIVKICSAMFFFLNILLATEPLVCYCLRHSESNSSSFFFPFSELLSSDGLYRPLQSQRPTYSRPNGIELFLDIAYLWNVWLVYQPSHVYHTLIFINRVPWVLVVLLDLPAPA